MKKIEFFKVEGDRINRFRRHCPKCGAGVFLAEHKNRLSCGKCGYTEFKSGGAKETKPPKVEEKPVETQAQEQEKPEESKVEEPKEETPVEPEATPEPPVEEPPKEEAPVEEKPEEPADKKEKPDEEKKE